MTHLQRLVGTTALALLAPTWARAGGFELPDNGVRAVGRGGATAVGAQDLTAVHYNPAVLARQSAKVAVMWHHNLVFHQSTFDRATLAEGWGPAYGGAEFESASDRESLFPLGGFLSVGSNFGLQDTMLALSVYGPSSVGKQDWEDYGPHSFMMTEADMLLVYYSASAAWQSRTGDFGFGATLQYVDMPKLQYELILDSDASGTLTPVPEDTTVGDTTTHLAGKLDLADRTGFTALVGAFWRPIRNLELGVSGRILPIKLEAEGGVILDKPELSPEGLEVKLPLTMPLQARGGVRWVEERFDVELDVFWENWSVIERYEVSMAGKINGQEVEDLVIEKQWNDTVSVRLGGDYRVVPEVLDVRVGGFWENGAAPEAYSHIDFPSFDRVGLGAGLTYHLSDSGVAISAAYMHVFQEERTVTEAYGKTFQQRPLTPCPQECGGLSGVVANAGKFTTNFDIVSLGLDFSTGL
jgi:long-subunit fatty acid transport protein